MIRLSALLALLPLRGPEAPSATAAAPLASRALPAAVLPHCLYGLDPHDSSVQPWPKGPEPQGYEIELSSRLHLLSWLGFQRGDIVTAVNEQPLGSAEHHYAARQATREATTCRWRVTRGERTGVIEATITPDEADVLVLERDEAGMPTRLSRAALLRRISDPYAFGRYPSMLAMGADNGVYMVDKGMVALVRDLGFQPLDHHIDIAGVEQRNGLTVLAAMELLLTEPRAAWRYSRGGQVRSLDISIEGEPFALPAVPPTGAQPDLDQPEP
jgi:hypothetical protein